MSRYQVMVDDNFHYMDESERYMHGSFDTLEAAIEACRRVVDSDLAQLHKPGMSPDRLFELYTSFGADPFVLSAEPGESGMPFSARDYARERSRVIASSSR